MVISGGFPIQPLQVTYLSARHRGCLAAVSRSGNIHSQPRLQLKTAARKLLLYLAGIVLILIGIRKIRERSWGWCKNTVQLTNKVAIITGANSGIGYEVAKELASRNAEVILACRDGDLATEAVAQIEKQFRKKLKLTAMKLDLASLKSIKDFATNVQKLYPQIHLLINNAGVAYPKNQIRRTSDDFETQFGVNHLGHFYLTNLLLDTLKKSAPSRVIILSSSLHRRGEINFYNLEAGTNLYANSKLANVYFGQELSRRLIGSGVNVYIVCPGWVYTSLFRHWLPYVRWYHYIIIVPLAFFFMRVPRQGAQTVVFCATDPDLENESGLLYRNCKQYTSKVQFDKNVALKLWSESERLIKERNY